MNLKNNKKLIFGALSAVVASVAAGVLVKNNIDKKTKNVSEEDKNNKKEKKSKQTIYHFRRCQKHTCHKYNTIIQFRYPIFLFHPLQQERNRNKY